jgi:hypothetical protein
MIKKTFAAMVSGARRLFRTPSRQAQAVTFDQRFPDAPRDAVERRSRSIAQLKAQNVPVNDWLPLIESEEEIEPKSTTEIALRAVVLVLVALKTEGLESQEVEAVIRKFDLAASFTPSEQAFINDPSPNAEQKAALSWRYEAAYVLFWALGYTEELTLPRTPCNPVPLVKLLQERDRDELIGGTKPKPLNEILDQADLIYRYRWALVSTGLSGTANPAGLDNDVAMERHHALNWLVQDDAWDDISLDT